jgi:hypothetical protein
LQDQIKKLIAKVPRVERRHIPNEMLQSGSHPLMRVAPMLPEFKYRSGIAASIWDRGVGLGSWRRSGIAASIWDRCFDLGSLRRAGVAVPIWDRCVDPGSMRRWGVAASIWDRCVDLGSPRRSGIAATIKDRGVDLGSQRRCGIDEPKGGWPEQNFELKDAP